MKTALKSFLLAFITMFAGTVAFAQVTTSALQGRVVDQNGEPVIGAAIIAQHQPSGTVYGAVTNADGRYSIQGMRTGGPYSVEFSNLGYQSVNYTDITLQLAEAYNLNVWLQESSEFLDAVVVVATPTSKFAAQEKTGASTNISNTQILEMPTISRSISDIAKISPYGGNGMSLAGADGRTTNFTVDGANFNNNFGLSDNLPGGGTPISIDAIEEVQIVVSPFDVRQTNFVGGGINAITKSGTNTFKGSVYGLYEDEHLHGNRVDGKALSKPLPNKYITYGLTLGGPIIKNKLFFFINAERYANPGVVNRWRPSADGVADANNYISRTTEADMKTMSDFLSSKYHYDAGSYSSYPGDQTNTKLLARLDWNITNNHHLAFRYNFTLNKRWSNPNGNSMDNGPRMAHSRMSDYSMGFANNMYSQDNLVHSFSLDLNSRFGNNLSNQFLVTFSKLDDVRGSNSAPFPHVDIMKDGDAYMSFGYELFTWNNGVHNNTINAKDELVYYAGAHKLTGGISYEYQMADNAYMRGGTGYYRYKSMEDFMNGAAPDVVSVTYGYDGEQNPAARVQYHKVGVYFQDEWDPVENLKLVAGLRLDEMIFDNSDIMTNNAIYNLVWANGQRLDTGLWPKPDLQISPRLGFTWDVLGDRSLKIRGGTGLFTGRLPLVFFTNMPTNTLMVQNARAGYGNGAEQLAQIPFYADVNDLISKLNSLNAKKFPTTITPDDGVYSGNFDAVANNFKMPEVWKSSIGIDYVLPVSFPLTFTGEFTYNKTINGVYITNWNIEDNSGWATYSGADKRHIYPKDAYINYPANSTDPGNALVLSNTNKGYGYIASAVLSGTPLKNLNITVGYTHTVSKELTGMPGSNASSAYEGIPTIDGPNFMTLHNSQYVTPHRIFANVNYTIKEPLGKDHFSLFYEAMSPANYSYTYQGDFNNDGVAELDLMYIPADSEMGLQGSSAPFRFKSQADMDAYKAFAAQDKYLSSHKGQYAEAYSVAAPLRHSFDFRYAHDFIVKIGGSTNTLQLSVDIKNLSNLLNSSWGYSNVGLRSITGSYYNIRPLVQSSLDPDGVPVFKSTLPENAATWELSKTYTSLWYMQLGIKYMFN
ncbi:MAG: carboxypeptidase regulatory-like domain-containing protein [Bacteroidales bacterium]|nr:carboxypeptidase regulatory-like domain-containing protein [Bacteroidales bacterium]